MGIHLEMITPSVHFVVGITSHTKYNFLVGAMKIEVSTITINEQQLYVYIILMCSLVAGWTRRQEWHIVVAFGVCVRIPAGVPLPLAGDGEK